MTSTAQPNAIVESCDDLFDSESESESGEKNQDTPSTMIESNNSNIDDNHIFDSECEIDESNEDGWAMMKHNKLLLKPNMQILARDINAKEPFPAKVVETGIKMGDGMLSINSLLLLL